MLINLKTPEVFDHGKIRRLAEKAGEAPDMANVILLRVLADPPFLEGYYTKV